MTTNQANKQQFFDMFYQEAWGYSEQITKTAKIDIVCQKINIPKLSLSKEQKVSIVPMKINFLPNPTRLVWRHFINPKSEVPAHIVQALSGISAQMPNVFLSLGDEEGYHLISGFSSGNFYKARFIVTGDLPLSDPGMKFWFDFVYVFSNKEHAVDVLFDIISYIRKIGANADVSSPAQRIPRNTVRVVLETNIAYETLRQYAFTLQSLRYFMDDPKIVASFGDAPTENVVCRVVAMGDKKMSDVLQNKKWPQGCVVLDYGVPENITPLMEILSINAPYNAVLSKVMMYEKEALARCYAI